MQLRFPTRVTLRRASTSEIAGGGNERVLAKASNRGVELCAHNDYYFLLGAYFLNQLLFEEKQERQRYLLSEPVYNLFICTIGLIREIKHWPRDASLCQSPQIGPQTQQPSDGSPSAR